MSELAPKHMPTFLCNIYHLEMLTKLVTQVLILHVDKK